MGVKGNEEFIINQMNYGQLGMLRDIILYYHSPLHLLFFFLIPIDLMGGTSIVSDTSDVMVSMKVCVKTITLSIS